MSHLYEHRFQTHPTRMRAPILRKVRCPDRLSALSLELRCLSYYRRCLVKMQKRGQDHCPCCRAPVVLKADRSTWYISPYTSRPSLIILFSSANVDWAMLNFMQDWFPRESQLKLKQNELESTKEQMEELGFNDQPCRVM